MYKRILSILAALAILVTIAACNDAASETGTDPVETTTAPTENDTLTTEATQPAIPFETLLVDDDNVTFQITGIEPDGLLGYTVKLFAANKTNENLMFSVRDVSVNGFMCDPLWASTISGGMKSNEQMSFLSSDFARNGIEEVTSIRFTLTVYNSDDWTKDPLVHNTYTVYPLGENKVENFVRIPVAGETVLVDDDVCKIIVTGFDPGNTFGYGMHLYVENKTEKSLMFTASDVAVNGYMCDPYWSVAVAPGMRSNTTMTWFQSDLDANGIQEVTEISLPIRVYNNDNWAEDDLIDETFLIHP